jgi:hypothetical protein
VQVEASGVAASHELRSFLLGVTPNVIWSVHHPESRSAQTHISFIVCKYLGTARTNATVLLLVHYDSRGSFGSVRALGGRDDDSGTPPFALKAHQTLLLAAERANCQWCVQGGMRTRGAARERDADGPGQHARPPGCVRSFFVEAGPLLTGLAVSFYFLFFIFFVDLYLGTTLGNQLHEPHGLGQGGHMSV